MNKIPILTEKDTDFLEERFKQVFTTKDDLQALKSDLVDKLDKILKEIVASREEQEVLSQHSSSHEDRLACLEKIHPQYQHP